MAKNVSLDIFVQDLKLGCEVLDTSSISFACVCLFNKLDQRGMSNVNIKIFVPHQNVKFYLFQNYRLCGFYPEVPMALARQVLPRKLYFDMEQFVFGLVYNYILYIVVS